MWVAQEVSYSWKYEPVWTGLSDQALLVGTIVVVLTLGAAPAISASGASLGRALLGLRVCRFPTDAKPSGRALIRLGLTSGVLAAFAGMAAAVILGPLAFVILGATLIIVFGAAAISLAASKPPKRAWYDKLSGTWVIDLRAAGRAAARQAAAPRRVTSGGVPAPPGANGFAVAALILGILGVSVLAIVFGHIARSQIKNTGQEGAGMALAGLILGYISLAVALAGAIALVVIALTIG
jgi:uncharacterized RDD family membrane protein YckC